MGCRSVVSMCLVSLVGSEHVLPVRHKFSRSFILESGVDVFVVAGSFE